MDNTATQVVIGHLGTGDQQDRVDEPQKITLFDMIK